MMRSLTRIEVRARQQPGAQAVRAQERLDHAARRGLAVRAGDVDDRAPTRCGSPSSSTARRVGSSRGCGAASPTRSSSSRVGRVGRRAGTRPRVRRASLVIRRRSVVGSSHASNSPSRSSSKPQASPHRRSPSSRPSARARRIDRHRVRHRRLRPLAIERRARVSPRSPRPRDRASPREPDRERDAVAHLESGVLAGLLHGAHDVAREPLGLELRRDARCRARTKPPPGGTRSRCPGRPPRSSSSYSPGSSSAMPPATTASPSADQSPAFAAWMTRCTSLPMRGPRARALTRQPLGDAEVGEARLGERSTADEPSR